ncbi:hypothetical protein FKM82_024675 [Ascaphus truei]
MEFTHKLQGTPTSHAGGSRGTEYRSSPLTVVHAPLSSLSQSKRGSNSPVTAPCTRHHTDPRQLVLHPSPNTPLETDIVQTGQ